MMDLVEEYIKWQLGVIQITKLDVEHLEKKKRELGQRHMKEEKRMSLSETGYQQKVENLELSIQALHEEMEMILKRTRDCEESAKQEEMKEVETLAIAVTKKKEEHEKVMLMEECKYRDFVQEQQETLNHHIDRRMRLQEEIGAWKDRFRDEIDSNSMAIQDLKSELEKWMTRRQEAEQSIQSTNDEFQELYERTEEKKRQEFNRKCHLLSQTIAARRIQRKWRQYKTKKPKKGKKKGKKK